MIISDILASIGLFCINLISSVSYFGIFILMAMESMVIPIPAELVMPFAGFLSASGKMNMILIIIFSTLGSLFGSLLSYYIGKYGGNKFILKFGKYVFLDETDLIKTEKWFSKRGEITIFFSRFIPVVRHLISVPAGMGKMKISRFITYTILGAGTWNTILALFGYILGKNWELISKYSDYISIPFSIIVIFIIIYVVYRHVINKIKLKNDIKRN